MVCYHNFKFPTLGSHCYTLINGIKIPFKFQACDIKLLNMPISIHYFSNIGVLLKIFSHHEKIFQWFPNVFLISVCYHKSKFPTLGYHRCTLINGLKIPFKVQAWDIKLLKMPIGFHYFPKVGCLV